MRSHECLAQHLKKIHDKWNTQIDEWNGYWNAKDGLTANNKCIVFP